MACASLDGQYQILGQIGQGAYGTVYSAIEKTSGCKVAIKRINVVDQHETIALRTLRELRLLRHFNEYGMDEHITMIIDLPRPTSYKTFEAVYIVMNYMETDLCRVIRTQALSDAHCQYFIYQILRGLKAIGSAGIIHRDLKPSNILINHDCSLKICDFGLARVIGTMDVPGEFLTEYVATRWYRAPEIMLNTQKYTKAIDVWSLGCIVGELFKGEPLFPGRDYIHQLNLIFCTLGTPSPDDQKSIASQRGLEFLQGMPHRRGMQMDLAFPDVNQFALDFLAGCLEFNPGKRLTVEAALAHPYMATYHDPSDEPDCPVVDPSHLQFELQRGTYTREDLRRLLYLEIHRDLVVRD